MTPYAGPGRFPVFDSLVDDEPPAPRSPPDEPGYGGKELGPGVHSGQPTWSRIARPGRLRPRLLLSGDPISLTFVPFTEGGKLFKSGTGMPSRPVPLCR